MRRKEIRQTTCTCHGLPFPVFQGAEEILQGSSSEKVQGRIQIDFQLMNIIPIVLGKDRGNSIRDLNQHWSPQYVPKQECQYVPEKKCKKECGHLYSCKVCTVRYGG